MAKIFVGVFFAILFLQSAIDKIADRKGNLSWMTPHFEKSPFRAMVPLLLTVITLIELSAGLACAFGSIAVGLMRNSDALIIGLGLSSLALCCLFLGQRIAKDYTGAATLTTYFGVALLGLWITSISPIVR